MVHSEDQNSNTEQSSSSSSSLPDNITALDVSPDLSRVAVGSANGTMAIWSIETRVRIVGPLRHRSLSQVSSLKFSPAGGRIASGYLAVGGDDCSIRLWHSQTGAQLESIRNPHSTYSLAWSVDGHRLFAGGPNGSIRDLITLLYVSNSGQFLVSISSGRASAIDIWNILTIPPSRPLRCSKGVYLASVSPDDTRLITVGMGNDIVSWDLSTLIHRTYLSRHLSLSEAYSNPFTYISNAVLEAWKGGYLEEAEKMLGEEIGPEDEYKSQGNLYAHLNRALLRLRRGKWDDALMDVQAMMKFPKNDQVNLIARITEGVARHGQGNCKEAINTFRSTLCDRDIGDLIKCIKSITLLEHPDEMHSETDIDDGLLDGNLLRLVEARKLLLRIRDYHMDTSKDYKRVLALSEAVPDVASLLHLPEAKIISLKIFGWDLHELISEIHELRCRALYESNQSPPPGVVSYFPTKRTGDSGDSLNEELESIQTKLSLLSEDFGHEATCHSRYDEAIAWYSEALIFTGCPSDIVNKGLDPTTSSELVGKMAVPLTKNKAVSQHLALLSRCPQCIAHLLAKRSEAKAKLKLLTDALTDAAWAIEIDCSYPWGYERKFAVLHTQGHFEDAVVPKSTAKLRNYSKTIDEISDQINVVFDKSPFVLIDVKDGRLCNQERRRSIFEKDARYYTLVSESSMSTVPDADHIKEVVEGYFCYVMFSHTWEGEEPSFEVVSQTPVYRLGPSLLNQKLRNFCETVRDDYKPYRWSWSDTCCINKTDRDTSKKSIRFMYKWYHNSALTLVLLAYPSNSNPRDSPYLEHNRWMFRAWTLQELLASKVIRLYKRSWELYLNGGNFNHKTLPELQGAMVGAKESLRDFSPAALTVRQRLYLASTRDATLKVDIAYALIGIFNSDIDVDYTREGETALGLLLQEVVNRQGDTTVLDWIGTPSKFNSALPTNLSVYKPGLYKPYELPPIPDDMVNQREIAFHNTLREEAATLHNRLSTLGSPRFADRHLRLPCITFSIIGLKRNTSSSAHGEGTTTYLASIAALGEVQFKTRDTSFSKPLRGRVLFVYPWIRDLLAQTRGHARGGKHTKHTCALRMVIHLEQGFSALLFAEQSDRRYRRVAADEEIFVPARELTSMEDVDVEVLEIWEKS
ncbi:hypothetical protein L210DRAFT_3653288 [Boletus edulis BED1]|uniref:Heterokaryon incompatibility domain-containing protein n=1 Tax=Boletus edulis BED1 TaxID=1328754 RepID=A0AAD4BFF5_BOLED|nr:hypothetical protein L210DRAFT_3653288 [Boletus edulis BED1]